MWQVCVDSDEGGLGCHLCNNIATASWKLHLHKKEVWGRGEGRCDTSVLDLRISVTKLVKSDLLCEVLS